MSGTKQIRNRLIGLAAFCALAGVLLWFFLPRQATPTQFDPENLSAIEAGMWRAYYEKNYPRLTQLLWRGMREEFGGSPYTGLRIAVRAADAARRFQRSRDREQARDALPPLIVYYTIIQEVSGADFDPAEAAREELEWWQLRREDASLEEISNSLARLYALTYGMPLEEALPSARLRVEAMAYRDARRSAGMTDADWVVVRETLLRSYTDLRDAIKRVSCTYGGPLLGSKRAADKAR